MFSPIKSLNQLWLHAIAVLALSIFSVLYLTDYHLFHIIIELSGVVVAFSLFAVFASCRRFLKEGFFPLVGLGYLFVGILELFHLIAADSMGTIFQHRSDINPQIQLTARFVEALTLAFAPLYITRRARLSLIAIAYVVFNAAVISVIVRFDRFPFFPYINDNLTTTMITLLLGLSLFLFWQRRRLFEFKQVQMVMTAIIFAMASNLCFVFQPASSFSFLGHLFKLSSFILMFWALINRSVSEPMSSLFQRLTRGRSIILASERRFRSLFDNMMNGFALQKIVTDRQGNIIDVLFLEMNPAFERLSGLESAATVGRRFSEVFPNSSIEELEWFKTFGSVGISGRQKQFECCFELIPNRDKRWYKGLAFSPEPGHIAVILEDIQAEIENEAQRRRMETKLQYTEKQESLRMLAAGVAHDFNNLLTGVLANADLAGLETTDPVIRDFLDQIKGAANQAANLSRQMLAYSGGGRFEDAPVQLSNVIDEMSDLMAAALPKSIHLDISLTPLLPMIKADEVQIRQTVMGLITNAAEAIGDTQGEITVRTELTVLKEAELARLFFNPGLRAGPHIALEVRDNGCGIPDDMLPKIFDPFFTTKFMGRGLGLASTLGIIRRHRGGIHVESNNGQSTKITLYFPRALQPAINTPLIHRQSPPKHRTGIVLVADDEPFVRLTTCAMLEKLGFQAVAVCDGASALKKFKQESRRFDLMILDLSMPDIGGEAILTEIRKIRPEIPVLLASGYSETVIQYDLESDPHTAFSQKPFGIKHLQNQVQTLLKSTQRRIPAPPQRVSA